MSIFVLGSFISFLAEALVSVRRLSGSSAQDPRDLDRDGIGEAVDSSRKVEGIPK
jgi:hypothetical protein